MKPLYFLILSFFFWSNVLFSQDTLRVPTTYSSIQSALNAASENDLVLVSPGIYNERLIWPGLSTLSLISTDGSSETIIDGNQGGTVIKMPGNWDSGPNEESVLKGFTIRNGSTVDQDGAGIYLGGGRPTFEDLVLEDNECTGDASWGCGMALRNFAGTIRNCRFDNNVIDTDSRAYGAGANIEFVDDAVIENCDFVGNVAGTDSWAYGGGLYLDMSFQADENAVVDITNCRFITNSTTTSSWSYGAGIYASRFETTQLNISGCHFEGNQTLLGNWRYGGAIHAEVAKLKIENCTFNENVSVNGLAIHVEEDWGSENTVVEINGCEFSNHESGSSNPEYAGVLHAETNVNLNNSVFHHNYCSAIATGFISSSSSGSIDVQQTNLVYNLGGISANVEADFSISNSIIWNYDSQLSNGTFDVKYSIVKGGYSGVGVLSSDPLFTDEYNFIPQTTSPCLGAGQPNSLTTDIAGNSRPNPPNSFPDIGAYEIYQQSRNIRASFYYDENGNGEKEADEQNLSVGQVRIDGEVYSNFLSDGILQSAELGEVSVEFVDLEEDNWYLTSEASYVIDVIGDDFYEEVSFGLLPTIAFTKLESSIYSGNFRCGEWVDFEVSAYNNGTTIETGVLWFNVDERIEEIYFETLPDTVVGDYTYGWYFEDLFLGETFRVDIQIKSPLIEDEADVGQLFYFKAWTNEVPARDFFCYDIEHRCSFDPNDKQVFPNRPDSLALLDGAMQYLIRFQNTGNDYAKDVVLVDTLSEHLDMNTFRVLGSSHPELLQVKIEEERHVQFIFNNIFLPDSLTQPEASQGYVQFLIYPKEGLAEETVITNTGHIYFDFNPAIVTNQTHSILVEEFPIVSIDPTDVISVHFYPNPATDIIQFNQTVESVRLFDGNGRVCMQAKQVNQIDVGALSAGIYIIEINGQKELHSVVIE